jgi:hypothetical protein
MKHRRGVAKLRIVAVDGRLSRIGGRVRTVLSKRPGERWKTTVAIVTNETGLSGREIVSVYELRWNIEVLFKELEVDLGLGVRPAGVFGKLRLIGAHFPVRVVNPNGALGGLSSVLNHALQPAS